MYLKLILVIVFQLFSENGSNLLTTKPNLPITPTLISLTSSPPTIQKPSINLNLFQI
jgi:hypothetical protein